MIDGNLVCICDRMDLACSFLEFIFFFCLNEWVCWLLFLQMGFDWRVYCW